MNMKKIIQTNKAPAAIGPYAQGTSFQQLVFTSGQIGLAPTNTTLPLGIEEQTKQAMENCKAVLQAGGSDFDAVLKVTIFVTNLVYAPTINQIYASYFSTTNYPARSFFQVGRLPKDALIEIEMIGHIK